jgi:hypothetical protein
MQRQWSMNINISKMLHRDGKEWEHRIRIYSVTGCWGILTPGSSIPITAWKEGWTVHTWEEMVVA